MNRQRVEIQKQLSSIGRKVLDEKISVIDSSDKTRECSIKTDLVNFDYSKQRINKEVFDFLLDIPEQLNFRESLDSLFKGEFRNLSEDRNVSHTLYRSASDSNVSKEIYLEREKIKKFLHIFKKSKKIKNIISISIGGSRLGAELLHEFQSATNPLNLYFCSSYDLLELNDSLRLCIQEETIVLVVSKSFETLEVLKNLDHVKSWYLNTAHLDYRDYVYGISSNTNAMKDYGIKESNQFKLLESLGGRFSVWSSVSLPSFINSDYDNYLNLLAGARLADEHTHSSEWSKNIPVLMALFSIFNSTSLNINNHAIFTYNFRLRSLTKYISQLSMESNGKSINFKREESPFPTTPLVWGGYGIEAQHSTFQWLMQGKTKTSCDFIGINESTYETFDSQEMLLSQVIAMSYGENNKRYSYQSIPGNNPCSIILLNSLDIKNLGFLLALYEHKVFIESLISGVDPFDQWGVQLGKKLASNVKEDKQFLNDFFDTDFVP